MSVDSVDERTSIADPSQRQHGVVLKRTIDEGDRSYRIDRIRGAIVAERVDYGAAEEIEPAADFRDERALHRIVCAAAPRPPEPERAERTPIVRC